MADNPVEMNQFIMSMQVLGLDQLEYVHNLLLKIESAGKRISAQSIGIGIGGGKGAAVAGAAVPAGTYAGFTTTATAGAPAAAGAAAGAATAAAPRQTGPRAFGQADFGIVAKRVFMWGTATMIIFKTISAIREAVEATKELEMQMVQLEKVMPNDTNFGAMRRGFFDMSQLFGEQILNVAGIGKIFAQTGLNETEVLNMTKVALLGVNSANLTAAESVEFLISSTRAYNIEIEKTGLLLDKIMRVQAHYPVEARELALAFQRGASVFKMLNLSPDVLFGYTAAVKAVTRESPETIIQGLRTTLMRSLKPQAVEAFRGVGITGVGREKTVFDAYSELAEKMKTGEISPEKMRELSAAIVGDVRRMRHFLALMDNYDMALNAIRESEEAYGDAQRANMKQMDTIQKKIDVTGQHWKEFAVLWAENGIIPSLEVMVSLLGDVAKGMTALQGGIGGDITGGLTAGLGAAGGATLLKLLSGGKILGGFGWLAAGQWIGIITALGVVLGRLSDIIGEQQLWNAEFKKTIDNSSIATKEFEEYFGSVNQGVEATRKMADAMIAFTGNGKEIKTVNDLAEAMRNYGIEVGDVNDLYGKFISTQRFWQYELYGNIERLKVHFESLKSTLAEMFQKKMGEDVMGNWLPTGIGKSKDWINIKDIFGESFKDLRNAMLNALPKGWKRAIDRATFNFAEEIASGLIGSLGEQWPELKQKVLDEAYKQNWNIGSLIAFLLEPSTSWTSFSLPKDAVKKMYDSAYDQIKDAIMTRSEFGDLRLKLGIQADTSELRGLQLITEITEKVLKDLVPDISKAQLGTEEFARYVELLKTKLMPAGAGQTFVDDFIFRISRLNDELFESVAAFHTQQRMIETTGRSFKEIGMGYDKAQNELDSYLDTLSQLDQLGFGNEEETRKVKNAIERTKNLSMAQLKAMEEFYKVQGGKVWDAYSKGMEAAEVGGFTTGKASEVMTELQQELIELQAENWKALYGKFGGTQALTDLLVDTFQIGEKQAVAMLRSAPDIFVQGLKDMLISRIRTVREDLVGRELRKNAQEFNLEMAKAVLGFRSQMRIAGRDEELPESRLANLKDELGINRQQFKLELAMLEARKQQGEFDTQEGQFVDGLYKKERDLLEQKYVQYDLETRINYALDERSKYVDAYMQNVSDLRSAMSDMFSDLEGWQDQWFGVPGDKALPFLDFAQKMGQVYSKNIASQLTDSIMGVFNAEGLGNVLGGGNLKIRAYAEGGQALVDQAQAQIFAGKDIIGNKSLIIETQQLEVLRQIYMSLSGTGLNQPFVVEGEKGQILVQPQIQGENKTSLVQPNVQVAPVIKNNAVLEAQQLETLRQIYAALTIAGVAGSAINIESAGGMELFNAVVSDIRKAKPTLNEKGDVVVQPQAGITEGVDGKSIVIEGQQLEVLRQIYMSLSGLEGTPGVNAGPDINTKQIDAATRKQMWNAIAAQAGMMGGTALGASMGGRSDFTSTGASIGSMLGALIPGAGPAGSFLGGIAGGFIGGILSPKEEQVANDIHEIRVNTNSLRDMENQMINLPAAFTMPTMQGFYPGQSRGGSTPDVNVYVTVDSSGNVKSVQKEFVNRQDRTSTKYNQFGD